MPDRVVNTLAIQPELVGERLVTLPSARHYKNRHCGGNLVILGGERKVYQEMRRPLFASRCTPTRLRLLGTQRFQPAIETVAERSTFIPARQVEVVAERRLAPIQEEIISSPSACPSACDLGNPYQ